MTPADGPLAPWRALMGTILPQDPSETVLEEPIRAELFSVERLEQHAESLAAAQRVSRSRRAGRPLAPRLADNERVLVASYRAISAAIVEERAITPAADWLVDNFHVVKEQLREIREDLPSGFYRELPKLEEGPLRGYPRVYGLAWAFIAHTDSRIEPDTLRRFVRAYQRVEPLTMGEVWATAIALRVALVENLRRLAEQIVARRAARARADLLADELLDAARTSSPEVELLLARHEGQATPESFAVQLIQRLRDQEPVGAAALQWLDDRLAALGMAAEEVVRREHQRQAAGNVTVRNVITSMRLMSTLDWTEFFESVSVVEAELRRDAGYAAMDFVTRDRYRHAIEDLARGSALAEIEVTRRAMAESTAAARRWGEGSPEADPGYVLISKGRVDFERTLGFTLSLRKRLLRAFIGSATPQYVGTIALLTALVVAVPLLYARRSGVADALLLSLTLLALIPASDLAIALVNRLITELLGPRPLPRLELREGVPAELRTMIVVPTFLLSPQQVEEQVAGLEVHFLANPDGELHFALLSDWADAPAEAMPEDDALLARAREGIERLNARHGPAPGGGPRFLLFHRRRVWNASQGKWMGWERKRGKLHELNRLLRGASDTTFLLSGPAPPTGVRYVITLDADTMLPRGVAAKLVGTMAHRLHRPRLDEVERRVVDGYAVLQPRVSPSMSMEGRTIFQRVFSGPAGIDPYASAVSDVYQDLFREGSYTGKGIYDLDAFEAAMAGRVPENALLSHDLFEGIFTRAGLASDITLFEEFPSRYPAAAARQHRWARGDWQLLPWIAGLAHDATGRVVRVRIPFIGRWKMLDNLRRTLSAPTALLTLVAGWTFPGSPAAAWTGFVLATMAVPSLLPFLVGLVPRRRGVSKRAYLRAAGHDLAIGSAQTALGVTLLAHQAVLMADAVVRTVVRLDITRRMLLEWLTSAQVKAGQTSDVGSFFRGMWGAPLVAAGAAVAVATARPEAWPYAVAFGVLWSASPVVAWWISLPSSLPSAPELTPEVARSLRAVARRSWLYFETFVGEEDHFLPPDNYQEEPKSVVAHRTSPTNVGLYLLSTVAARDLGWLGGLGMAERLERTLQTVQGLERFRGHLFNWYDTRDLRPLDPRYISSVDSGNLAGYLLVLQLACRETLDRPVLGPWALQGIADALDQVRRAVRARADERRTQTVTREHMEDAVAGLEALLDAPPPSSPAAWASHLDALSAGASTLADTAHAIVAERGESDQAGLLVWTRALTGAVRQHARDLDLLMPWSRLDPGGDLAGDVPALGELPDLCRSAIADLRSRSGAEPLVAALETSALAATSLVRRFLDLAELSETLFEAMDFRFLLDPSRKLFSIGYRVRENELDPSCYDLLASEARLTSFLAVARGDVPSSHWFRLSRVLTPVGTGSALLSWSGSMFEYLMPALVMESPRGSLLDQTYRAVVRRQIRYGAERGVPWGISESAYAARDLELTYQYSSFGVPGLGLKRALGEELVVAPYATALAAMVEPAAAAANFEALAQAGAGGPYGFYEALDYTPSRLPQGHASIVVRAFMAHHQGMFVTSLANVLQWGLLRARFHAEPIVRSAELLLQERTPVHVAVERPTAEEADLSSPGTQFPSPVLRRFTSPHDPIPRTHLLSNGRYSVMLTAAGSGYSRWRDLAVSRWREDVTRDAYGSYIYLRDVQSGAVWSAAHQPTGVEADRYEVAFSEERAEIVRRDGSIGVRLDVIVSAEDDAEVRQVTLTNLGTRAREIEVTSYLEVVLAPHPADLAHPAFSNLFVNTEFVPERGALLATRRKRAADEPSVWAAHLAAVEGESLGSVQFETDRARFLGRGRDVRAPLSVTDGRPLSNTAGAVLDPIFSLRRRVRLAPGAAARIVFTTLVAPSREEALSSADKHRDPAVFDRIVAMVWTQAQVQLHHFGIGRNEAHLFQRLANRILYSDPSLRPASSVLKKNARGPASLWAHGISGDRPIVLVRIDEPEEREIVRQLLRAHEYWNLKRLAVDLVILNERGASYAQDLQSALEAMVRTSEAGLRHTAHEHHGGVFILRADLVSNEDRELLQSVARAVLVARRGSLASQVARPEPPPPEALIPRPPGARPPQRTPAVPPPRADLEFWNGLGGFAAGGREYVTVLEPGQWTPAPWINVISNPSFGFQVSESGSGYTWSGNSRQNKLTSWSNDPVSDPCCEALYLRDEESGDVFGPTRLPLGDDGAPYVARHGQGYSRFEHESGGIRMALVQLVAPEDPVKISRLTVENRSGRRRLLSVTAYLEWVLGTSREETAPHVITEIDPASGALLARNPWRQDSGDHVAFLDLRGLQQSFTADRTDFLGRNGTLAAPAAVLGGDPLSGRSGAGLDPCGALRGEIDLAPGETKEIVVLLGDTGSREEALLLVARYRKASVEALLREVERRWDEVLGFVQVTTPDRALDLLLNRWLLYQTLSCRLWARAGFYQAGGAYGFRDQLQDGMALAASRGAFTRAHLLRAASRQFVEGDVQHWWHPPDGRGVRTRISDDRIWLPFATVQYLQATGDRSVLDEEVPFLEGAALAPHEQDRYFEPAVSPESATLFEHCARALEASLTGGAHGLPLMGSGDWNDGMNRVGHEGKGESVWLAWFLARTLTDFAEVAASRGETARAERWQAHARALVQSTERHAWDGDWYLRAWFDDGTPLGSVTSDECRLDSIAQSWAVISGKGDPSRSARAMEEVNARLVLRESGLVLLFTPPFDRSSHDPGYIMGYPPGVRENGGQYTHAALWSVLAFAMMGDGDRAGELLSALNPIHHSATRTDIHRYKVEPYVVAGDVYAEHPHVGRGGWTWYTGSAGWMYRVGVEAVLGFRLHGRAMEIDPCIPRAWPAYRIVFRYHSATYEIEVENPRRVSRGVSRVEVDGAPQQGETSGEVAAQQRAEGGVAAQARTVRVPLADDGKTHRVRVVLG